MKSAFSVLLCFLLIACSNNEGDTKLVNVPSAPKDLEGLIISNEKIDLLWSYDLNGATGFKIERKTGTGIFEVIVTLNSNSRKFSDTGLTPGTTYFYRVKSFNSGGDSKNYSNELTLTTPITNELPSIPETTAISEIKFTSAVIGVVISGDGGCAITEAGIVYSANPHPTIMQASKAICGVGTGFFKAYMEGLVHDTKYYVRAYATNAAGTIYGKEISFMSASNLATDIDGNTYEVIQIAKQMWTKSNLNVSRYRNGDPIPHVTDLKEWPKLTTGAWCYYENNTANGPVYGKLYNWYAVNDPRGLAPEGYHIPSLDELTILKNIVDKNGHGGGSLKALTLWKTPNVGATNSTQFTALPGGALVNNSPSGSVFHAMGTSAGFWCTTVYNDELITNDNYANSFCLINNDTWFWPGPSQKIAVILCVVLRISFFYCL